MTYPVVEILQNKIKYTEFFRGHRLINQKNGEYTINRIACCKSKKLINFLKKLESNKEQFNESINKIEKFYKIFLIQASEENKQVIVNIDLALNTIEISSLLSYANFSTTNFCVWKEIIQNHTIEILSDTSKKNTTGCFRINLIIKDLFSQI